MQRGKAAVHESFLMQATLRGGVDRLLIDYDNRFFCLGSDALLAELRYG